MSVLHAVEKNGELLELSKQEILDALYLVWPTAKDQEQRPKPNKPLEENYGNYTSNVFLYAMEFGIAMEEDYPYKAVRDYIPKNTTNLRKMYIRDFACIDGSRDRNAIKDIIKRQPIVGSIPVYPSFEVFSGEEIYPGQHRGDDQKLGNHSVLIVGFETVGGRDVYLIKNSWETSWADGGYAWVYSDFVKNLCYPIDTYLGLGKAKKDRNKKARNSAGERKNRIKKARKGSFP